MDSTTPRMDWSAENTAETFRLFEQRLKLYFKVKNIAPGDQTSHLLLLVGEEGLKRYNAWTLTRAEQNDIEILLTKFKEQLEPAENFRVRRLQLMSLRQQPEESLDNFVNRAKLLAKKCAFTETELGERLLELIIAGTPDNDFRKNLLNQPAGYTLQEALKLGRQFEATAAHIKELSMMKSQPLQMAAVGTTPNPCGNCGGKHKPRSCPAFGTKCSSCGKLNHWAKVCRSQRTFKTRETYHNPKNKTGRGHYTTGQVHNIQAEGELEGDFDQMCFYNIQVSSIQSQTHTEAFATLQVKLRSHPGTPNLRLKVDTGAQGNTLPLRLFREMFPEEVAATGLPKAHLAKGAHGVRLTAYNGTNIPCHGIITIPCQFKGSRWEETQFYIVDIHGPAIIGLPSCEQLQIVRMNCTITSSQLDNHAVPINNTGDPVGLYPEQFDRIGKFKGPVKLVTDANVPPHVDAPRKTPIAQQRETLQPHEIPTGPWEVIGADLFQLHGNDFLLVADYYSKFFAIRKMTNTSSTTVIRAMKQIFSEHGIPDKVISDNGPQFASENFSQFAADWSFTHVTSSPTYPQSNGFIERHIQTVKACLTKAYQAQTDTDLALLCLRTTPISQTIPSPMELLTGRKARANIPTRTTPSLPDPAREELLQRQKLQKAYYDQHTKDLPDLATGQQVRVRDQTGRWQEAEKATKCDQPRSYIIRTPAGQELRRNRIHLRTIPQPPKEQQPAPTPPPRAEAVPREPVTPQPADSTPQTHTNNHYTTRCGRISRPPQKLHL